MTPDPEPQPALPAGMLLEAFARAPDPPARVEAFADLVAGLRGVSGEGEDRSAFSRFVDSLEASEESRERFRGALLALVAETDATDLMGSSGIPGHRGFLSELGARLSTT